MTYTVRRARPDEYQHIGQLTLAGFNHLEPGSSLPDQERLSLLLDAQSRNEQGVLLVAEGADGKLVGSATLLSHGVPLARQAREGEAELRLLAVIPQARQQGLGWALLDEGAKLARTWGAHHLVLDTSLPNLQSQRLYRRFGFEYLPERDVHREPPKVPLVVFSYDLADRSSVTEPAPSEIRDAADALGFLRFNPLVAPG